VDLNDFRQQISAIKNMGSVQDLTVKIPGLNQMAIDLGGIHADREIERIQGILDSMTLHERSYPVLMTVPKHCLRIAAGAGVKPSEVSRLFTQFKAMRDMIFRLERGG
jgi:signal recognition particle subunit SRP54